MATTRIDSYRLGGGEPQTVWAVPPDEVDAVLGTATRRERTGRLRGLRDLGLLAHQPGRLSAKVRLRPAVRGDSGIVRVYAFTVPPERLPRRKRRTARPRQRIATW